MPVIRWKKITVSALKWGKDPIKGFQFKNVSKLKPFGVWLVISPFNFPGALSFGPVGAALVAGNTVVLKTGSGHLPGNLPDRQNLPGCRLSEWCPLTS